MAPSAAAIEITDIFRDIIKDNLRYCALCLRTENERLLVEPKSFQLCLCVLQLDMPEVSVLTEGTRHTIRTIDSVIDNPLYKYKRSNKLLV